jgi:hypothetical protein
MRDEKKESALSRAALGLHLEVVKCLILELGVDIGKSITADVGKALKAMQKPEAEAMFKFILAEWEKQKKLLQAKVVIPEKSASQPADASANDSGYKSPFTSKQPSQSISSTPTGSSHSHVVTPSTAV